MFIARRLIVCASEDVGEDGILICIIYINSYTVMIVLGLNGNVVMSEFL